MKAIAFACTTFLIAGSTLFAAAGESETVTLDRKTEIPGTTLQPGQYKFEVEDRLQDRAIVRITENSGDKHELVLAVPSAKVSTSVPTSGNLIFFSAHGSDKQSLQAWKCESCSQPLEFVYPKDEAVSITKDAGQPVMAVDPSYDKLPANLSPDDMKVVTLWLLAPKELTADGKGSGVEPTKLADLKQENTPAVASVPAPPAAPSAPAATVPSAPAVPATAVASAPPPATPEPPQTVASAAPPAAPEPPQAAAAPSAPVAPTQPAMPHTASATSNYALAGMVFLLASAILSARRYRLRSAAGARTQ